MYKYSWVNRASYFALKPGPNAAQHRWMVVLTHARIANCMRIESGRTFLRREHSHKRRAQPPRRILERLGDLRGQRAGPGTEREERCVRLGSGGAELEDLGVVSDTA
jgi:hypothetical protein